MMWSRSSSGTVRSPRRDRRQPRRWVALTRAPGERTREAHKASQVREPTVPHQHTILIVDDDADTREALAALLSLEEHMRVQTAAGGREALAAIAAGFAPCVVLLDYRMPGVDGGAAVDELRAAAPAVAVV